MSELLFVSPALPCPSGNGLRMRAWQFLLGAARDHRVTLVAGSPSFPDEEHAARSHLEGRLESVVVLPWRAARDPELALRRLGRRLRDPGVLPADWAAPTARHRRRLAALRDRRFDRVHVFRLYMLPIALELLGGDATAIDLLDLDDWESETRAAIAALRPGARLGADARAYAVLEREWLPRLRRIVVGSESDRRGLLERYGALRLSLVPNAIDVPPEPAPPPSSPPVLLFVGSLAYPPNADAIRSFATEVLPLLRRVRPDLRLDVVGGGAPASLARLLERSAGVRRLGLLPGLDAAYAAAHVVVVPLRAGGGTRLKVLEAFAHGRAVVASDVGVAGLELEAGIHYLRANSPDEWAERVARLLDDPVHRATIEEAARHWVLDRSLARGVARVADLLAGLDRLPHRPIG